MSSDWTPPSPLPPDGERFIPGEMRGNIELEHCHRYSFASQLVSDKAVLDIACGEGYGSALLARSARWVTGVDIARVVVEHAKRRYRAENLEFLTGSCTTIPIGDRTVDVVVSFETIEHHAEHDAMMREITRVLRPGGLLVISSPDKLEYSDKPSFRNPFHVKELYKDEFASLLATHFRNVRMLGQRVVLGSMLLGQQRSKSIRFHRHEPELFSPCTEQAPLYWVALASDDNLPPTPDSVYEQSNAELWAKVARERNSATTGLIRLLAAPNSRKLKSCLGSPWYLERNSDVAAAGIDPYEHWIETGAAEGRLPSSDTLHLLEDLLREREELLQQDFDSRHRQLIQAHDVRELTATARQQHGNFEAELAQFATAAERKLAALAADSTERERLLQQDNHSLLEQLQCEHALSHDILEQSQLREQQLRRDIQQLEERLQSTQGDARGALEQARRESQEEAEQAQRQSQAERMSLQEELAHARREASEQVDSLLQDLVARERAMADQLAKQQAEFALERQRQAKEADRKLEKLAAEHASREREIQQDLHQLRERSESTQRDASQRLQAQLKQSVENEQMFAAKLLEQQADVDRQLKTLAAEFAVRDLQLRDEIVALHGRWGRVIAEERSLLQAQYSSVLTLFKRDLEALQASVSWRLAAPIRAIAAAFGSKTTLPRTEAIESLIRMSAGRGD